MATKKQSSKPAKTKRGWRTPLSAIGALPMRLVLRRLALTLVLVCALPFVLTLVYRVEAIKPVSTLMLARSLTFQPMDRRWIEIDAVAPELYQSVLVSEDGQFCSHHGIDLAEFKSVIEDALDGEATRGASTITMQTAKNLFLWNSRSYVRKVLELPLAVWIDLVLPKKRIMEIYLNIAEWDDDGVFGIEAGSQSQFGKSAADLSRREAALMAVTLPNPIERNPQSPNSGMRKLAALIEKRASKSGAYVKCLE